MEEEEEESKRKAARKETTLARKRLRWKIRKQEKDLNALSLNQLGDKAALALKVATKKVATKKVPGKARKKWVNPKWKNRNDAYKRNWKRNKDRCNESFEGLLESLSALDHVMTIQKVEELMELDQGKAEGGRRPGAGLEAGTGGTGGGGGGGGTEVYIQSELEGELEEGEERIFISER